MRAGCRCVHMVFVCFFFVTPRLAHCSFEGVYFEQVLCRCLWSILMPFAAFFSEGIALSDGLDSSYFCCKLAPQFSGNCRQKL